MSKLTGVADTLYIPLTSRIMASKQFPDFFYDAAALSLEGDIPGEAIDKNTSQYFMMASVARFRIFDDKAKDFIARRGRCNIVNLGVGFETSAFRISDPRATFYELDLPEVIESRERVLGRLEQEVLIGGDMFALEWMPKVDGSLPTMFIVSGVFQYFHEKDVTDFISALRESFPGSEIVFDAMDGFSLGRANSYVKKTGNESAMMHFSVEDPGELAKKVGAELIESRGFFKEAREQLGRRLSLYTRVATWFVDRGGHAMLILMKL